MIFFKYLYKMIFLLTLQLQSTEIFEPLTPLVQVSGLLQSRKTKEDVHSIVELCSTLSTAQVMKILKSYREDDYEAAMESVFIEKLTTKLNERTTMVILSFCFAILISENFNGIHISHFYRPQKMDSQSTKNLFIHSKLFINMMKLALKTLKSLK